MGRSVTCTYHVELHLSNKINPVCFGAMKLKDILPQSKKFAESYGGQMVTANVSAQTAAGRKVMKKDYLIIDSFGKIDHYAYTDKVPFYCF